VNNSSKGSLLRPLRFFSSRTLRETRNPERKDRKKLEVRRGKYEVIKERREEKKEEKSFVCK